MQFQNYIEESVYHQVEALLKAPPGGFTNPFNVYGEDNYFDDDFATEFPYVWLLGVRTPPRETRLPTIIIDMGNLRQSLYEIGTRDGNLGLVNLHIYARSHGERGDMASFFRRYLFAVPIYDYSTNPPVLKYTATAEGFNSQRITPSERIGLEGALANWIACSFVMQTID